MKIIAVISGMAVIALTFSCKKDNNTTSWTQPHDENRMMDSMHVMMSRMENMTMTMDPDIDFVEMMIMHHEGAINMSTALLEAGKDDSLRKFAHKVISDQQNEIAALKSIRATLTVDEEDLEFMTEQMTNMNKADATADLQLITGDIDDDYAAMMLIHHQNAIDDAGAYLHHGNNTELISIANSITMAQNKEIIELSNWIKQERN